MTGMRHKLNAQGPQIVLVSHRRKYTPGTWDTLAPGYLNGEDEVGTSDDLQSAPPELALARTINAGVEPNQLGLDSRVEVLGKRQL